MSDSRADAKRFDPRFDPAFQPGFDPTDDAAAAARAVPRRVEPTPPERWATPPEPAARSIAETTRPVESPAAPAPASDRSTDLDDLLAEQDDDVVEPERGVNPYAVVLWVVSIVLIAAGIVLFRSIPGLEAQNSAGGGAGGQSSLTQLLSLGTLSAMLIGTGLLVAAGNLFLLATRWRGR